MGMLCEVLSERSNWYVGMVYNQMDRASSAGEDSHMCCLESRTRGYSSSIDHEDANLKSDLEERELSHWITKYSYRFSHEAKFDISINKSSGNTDAPMNASNPMHL
jgi:hypothetical protein